MVCFSNRDLETLSSLDKFTVRIAELVANPRSSLATLTHRINERVNGLLAFLLVFITLPIVAIAIKIFSAYGLVTLILPISLVYLLYRFHHSDRYYHLNLQSRILANQKATAGASKETA